MLPPSLPEIFQDGEINKERRRNQVESTDLVDLLILGDHLPRGLGLRGLCAKDLLVKRTNDAIFAGDPVVSTRNISPAAVSVSFLTVVSTVPGRKTRWMDGG